MKDHELLERMDEIEQSWYPIAQQFAEARKTLKNSLDGNTRLGALATYRDARMASDGILDEFIELRTELLQEPTTELNL